jgi:hypothetical protein
MKREEIGQLNGPTAPLWNEAYRAQTALKRRLLAHLMEELLYLGVIAVSALD